MGESRPYKFSAMSHIPFLDQVLATLAVSSCASKSAKLNHHLSVRSSSESVFSEILSRDNHTHFNSSSLVTNPS